MGNKEFDVEGFVEVVHDGDDARNLLLDTPLVASVLRQHFLVCQNVEFRETRLHRAVQHVRRRLTSTEKKDFDLLPPYFDR